MAAASCAFREVRFLFGDEQITEVYVLLEAAGDCPIGVQGWHHKSFPARLSALDILKAHVSEAVLWPQEAPPQYASIQERIAALHAAIMAMPASPQQTALELQSLEFKQYAGVTGKADGLTARAQTGRGQEVYLDAQAAYAIWRFWMWSGNYGAYTEIDAAVSRGELTPGVYPPGYGPEAATPAAPCEPERSE